MSGGHLPHVRHALTSHHHNANATQQHQPAIAPNAWNHLQVPNFYPRQPQVAHMSSDRPLSHSPLTWHTPTPPEHQQALKGGQNLFRHTPTPPDIQILKNSSNPFRHTPTPPDRDSLKYRHTPTPPDGQNVKGAGNPFYRHTPTPPELVHSMKDARSLYRHTPPPDGHKGPPNPLFNLQQMIMPDNRVVQSRANEALRDNYRSDSLGFSRHSPGLVLGSMDLSVTRSPKNGSQNGDAGVPMSLSVRDTSKINSLDTTEITKIQIPSGYIINKAVELSKSSSPTPSSISQSSNSPKSPKPSNKRPVKKVDSILERLNSGSDGVVIMPVQHTPSPHSVIVSAHHLEDSNSRGSSSSSTITPIISGSNHTSCETSNLEKVVSIIRSSNPIPPENSQNTSSSAELHSVTTTITTVKEPQIPESHSVIKESASLNKDETPSISYSNEDSNGSSSDSSKSRRRRKQLKTTRIETDENAVSNFNEDTIMSDAPQNLADPKFRQSNVHENQKSPEISHISATNPKETIEDSKNSPKQNIVKDTLIDNPIIRESGHLTNDDNAISIPINSRRKTCSESETIDDIAAMIASTTSDTRDSEVENDLSIRNSDLELSSKANLNDSMNENLHQVLSSPPSESKEEMKNTSPETQILKRDECENIFSSDNKSEELDTKHSVDSTSRDDKDQPKTIVEVENELEKMFAGIEESELAIPEKISIQSVAPTIDILNDVPESINDKTSKKGHNSKKVSDFISGETAHSDDNTPKKRQKATKRKAATDSNKRNKKKSKIIVNNKKNMKKVDVLPPKDAYDSGSNASSSKSRGPYIQIKGPRDSPLSVSIINTPIQEDDVDKPLQKIRNLKGKTPLNTDVNFRNKVKSRGLHTSTLSTKYDATTTDTSWICVFCKRGPHTRYNGNPSTFINGRSQYMGDLFGPYIITIDCPDYTSMVNDPHDSSFKGKLNKQINKQSQRAKRTRLEIESSDADRSNLPNEEMYFGMTEASSNSYEIWLHEDCAVWAPGLYLVGPKLVGLETAVWSCCTIRCDLCTNLGATVACIKRGCQKTMHVNCARTDQWSLSEENFMVYCREHKLP